MNWVEKRLFPTRNPNQAKSSWLGLVLMLLALAVPSPLVGWFDGLPWSNPQELILILLVLPPVIVAGWKFLSAPWIRFLGALLISMKIVLWAVFPSAGLQMWIYDNPAHFASNHWEKTWGSLWHWGASAVIRRDLRDTREFPVEWANRFNQLGSVAAFKKNANVLTGLYAETPDLSREQVLQILGYQGNERFLGEALRKTTQPIVAVDGQVFLQTDETLRLQLDKFHEPETLVLQNPAGQAIASTWDKEHETLGFPPVSQDGWYRLSGSVILPPLEELDANLRIRIQDQSGQEHRAFADHRVWAKSPGHSGFFMIKWARAFSVFLDAACLLVVGWLGIAGLRKILSENGGKPFLVLAGLSVMAGWGGRLLGLSFVHSAGIAALFLAVLGAGISRGGWGFASPTVPRLFLAFSLAVAPFFIKSWWGELPRMSFFSVGDDWLAFQNHARNIFVCGDWLNLRTDPVYANQPGSRYWIGLGHLLFGQSAVSTRMIDLWSVVAACVLLATTALKLGSSVLAAWLAGTTAAAVFLMPPSGQLIGWGLQEPLAAAALAAVFYCAISAASSRLVDWLLAFWICWAFWLRMDHLPAILACGLFLLAPGLGGWVEIRKQWLTRLHQNSGKIAWFFFWLVFAVAAVLVRNVWAGSGLTFTSGSHLASKLPGNLPEAMQMPSLILRADAVGNGSISPMGWFLIGGLVIALLGVLVRLGPIRRIPVEPCVLFLATMAPYFLMREFAYAPRFSFHFVPIAGLLLALSASVLLPLFPGRDPSR